MKHIGITLGAVIGIIIAVLFFTATSVLCEFFSCNFMIYILPIAIIIFFASAGFGIEKIIERISKSNKSKNRKKK